MIGPQSDLEGIDLSGYPGLHNPPVDLSNSNLKNAKFVWTNVAGVNFRGANLESANFTNATIRNADFRGANIKSGNLAAAVINSSTKFRSANIIETNFVGSQGTPRVAGSLCSADTAFSSASVAYVFLLDRSIESSGFFIFAVINIALVPGWNVAGQCCFPVKGGIRIGC